MQNVTRVHSAAACKIARCHYFAIDERYGVRVLLSRSGENPWVPQFKTRAVFSRFIEGNDVFVSLPTGYGKSLCYAALPYAFDLQRFGSIEPKRSIVLAVNARHSQDSEVVNSTFPPSFFVRVRQYCPTRDAWLRNIKVERASGNCDM